MMMMMMMMLIYFCQIKQVPSFVTRGTSRTGLTLEDTHLTLRTHPFSRGFRLYAQTLDVVHAGAELTADDTTVSVTHPAVAIRLGHLSREKVNSYSINQSIKKYIPHIHNKVQHIKKELMWERGKCHTYNTLSPIINYRARTSMSRRDI